MALSTKYSTWPFKMFKYILVEKTLATLCFCITNFVIPFNLNWCITYIRILPGLLVIDILYGRIIIYYILYKLLNIPTSKRPIIEPIIYIVSLLATFAIVVLQTGNTEIMLFYGKKPWNCIAYYIIATAAINSLFMFLINNESVSGEMQNC